MRTPCQEFANPQEWLNRLAEEPDGYRRLVTESRGSGRAAYRLARARCAAAGVGEPRLGDLQAAAALLAEHLGTGGALPIRSLLPGPRSQAPAAVSQPPAAMSQPPTAVSQPPMRPRAPHTPVPLAPSQRRAPSSKAQPRSPRASV